jgi:glycosyltransferase involved in cell wall biosynthesis
VSVISAADVSVIMPVRDGERYLTEAIDSILDQSTPPGEIVVVDDGSSDTTPSILATFGVAIRTFRQEPMNQFVALNRGIAESHSPLLAFLDADDVFTPTSLECRLDEMIRRPELDAVFGHVEQFVSPELGPEAVRRFRFVSAPLAGEVFGAMLIRRSAFERVGELATGLRTSANIDWIARSRLVGLQRVTVPDVVARRRLHTTNISLAAGREKNSDLLKVLRAQRRRTTGPSEGDDERR